MLEIRPFKGLRPHNEYASQVASPPYDVLSSDEAREMVKNNPNSFLRINKPEVDFPSDDSLSSEVIFKKGLENLNDFISREILLLDEKPCFYLYRLIWQGSSQTGLVCLTSVDDYNSGKIKKHEHTRPVKVTDRAQHIITLNAQVGPVFSVFKKSDNLKKVFNKITAIDPDIDFTSNDNVRHSLWVVSDESAIEQIISIFKKMDHIYIADGHHRSEAASEVCRLMKKENTEHSGEELYNYFLNVIFPEDEVRILPYNRVVADLNNNTVDEFINKIKECFDITPSNSAVNPDKKNIIGMYLNNKWYQLQAKSKCCNSKNPSSLIEASILFDNLIKPILGIENIRTDKRIDFVGGIRGTAELEKLVKSGKWAVAFSLPPISVRQLIDVADAGEAMPPKSTWFEPKLRSGMVVNILDN